MISPLKTIGPTIAADRREGISFLVTSTRLAEVRLHPEQLDEKNVLFFGQLFLTLDAASRCDLRSKFGTPRFSFASR